MWRMDLETITHKIQSKMAKAGHIKARVKFNFGDEGLVFVDNTGDSPVISNTDAEADTTLSCSIETLDKIMSGDQDPTIAFMMGRLKVQGSMGLAIKLNAALED
jgi:putative sterol carrier protein